MADALKILVVAETLQGLFTQKITTGAHTFAGDEPVDMGGLDSAPAPYDFLMAALGSCTSMTLRMYARQKNWPLVKTSVTVTHHKETDADGKKKDIFTRAITLEGDLDDAQKTRLIEIANKCPVHRTLENSSTITTTLAA